MEMTFIGKITVIDAPCGAGKTSWAIQKMKENSEQAYIYCTPLLDEIERIRQACGYHRFNEPQPYNGTKINDFNDLLSDGGCIAVSHVTFLNATPETLERISKGEYTLIVDEALDVVMEFNKIQTVEDSPRQAITDQDMRMLREHNIIKVCPDYRVEWCGGEYSNDFKFAEVERLSKLGVLYCVRNKLLVTIFPPQMFRMFKQVYILTYMFDGNILKCYFQLFGLDYELASLEKNNDQYSLTQFTEEADLKFRQLFHGLVTVCNNSNLNKSDRSLTKAWYQKASAEMLNQLKNNLGNYFNRQLPDAKASKGDIMWTCPVDYECKLQGTGYTLVRSLTKAERNLPESQHKELEKQLKCFVPCNSRATNIYRSRWALAYCCNMYMNPMIRGFFMDYNTERKENGLSEIKPDQEQYALACLIQWICRSRIRDGLPISIYIPSQRMRELLLDWMDV